MPSRPGRRGARARCSRQVELAVLDAEGECFPFLGREREYRAVRLRGVAHQIELFGVRLVRPPGRVGGDRHLDAKTPGAAMAGPAPGGDTGWFVVQHGTRLLVTACARGQEAAVRSPACPAPGGPSPAPPGPGARPGPGAGVPGRG